MLASTADTDALQHRHTLEAICKHCCYGDKWQSPPVSSSLQVGQLALQRRDLVLLLSEHSAKLLCLACPTKQSAVLTVTGAGLVRPLRPLIACCTGFQPAGCNSPKACRHPFGASDQLPLVACMAALAVTDGSKGARSSKGALRTLKMSLVHADNDEVQVAGTRLYALSNEMRAENRLHLQHRDAESQPQCWEKCMQGCA